MDFSSFRFQAALRVLLLAACVCIAIWGWMVAQWLVTPVVAGVVALLCAGELVWFVERGQRELSAFLGSISHQDYSVPIPARKSGRESDRLERVYRLLAGEFKRLNLQKAANHQYLEAVVEHVGVALVSLDDTGAIAMMNEPARRLFGLSQVSGLKSFARFDPRLPGLLEQIQDGGRDLLRVQRGDELLQVVLYATSFTLLDRRYKLVSFQNIRDELEKREIESWQKLIRVLTHEIMNSVTPIISLSKVVQETLSGAEAQGRPLAEDERDDLLRSVNAVHSRSNGLLEFVRAYRSFATVPTPAFQIVDALSLLRRAATLMSETLAAQGIELEIDCPDDSLRVNVDPYQFEQVLINLLRNAAEALIGQAAGRVILRGARDERSRVMVQVIDNGPGVDPAHLENIFVPFFTTKRGGTGVGLSVSRQLVQANRGFIFVKQAEPRGCAFTLVVPAA
jgi:two-component system nitrogen regulation sensor histidine kinase NtrY